MTDDASKSAVEVYRSLRPLYEDFADKLESLLGDILHAQSVKFHVVESRAKEVSSFAEKISRPGKSYSNPLNDIKDLCGCRIILYYQDDIDRVADILKSEFSTSDEDLSRQPQLLEADRFGYLSAHYTVSVGAKAVEFARVEAIWKLLR